MPWMAIVGAAVSAAGSVEQGRNTKEAFDYNADMSVTNAAITEGQIRRKYGRLKGTQEAANAASGMAESGSFLEVMADQAYEAEKDALLARWTGATQSNLDKMQGENARTTGYIKAGGTLLGGISNFGQELYNEKNGVVNANAEPQEYTDIWKKAMRDKWRKQ
jgi:hypothetical protein